MSQMKFNGSVGDGACSMISFIVLTSTLILKLNCKIFSIHYTKNNNHSFNNKKLSRCHLEQLRDLHTIILITCKALHISMTK